MFRVCNTCHIEKPFSDFTKDKRKKLGIDAICKKCRYQKYDRKNYLANKEKRHADHLRWAKRNRESINKRTRERYADDPEKVLNRLRKYRTTDQGKAILQRYEAMYPEKIRAQKKLRDWVARGKINKPNICTLCRKETKWIDGHHFDYSKPLEVLWVCKKCHRAIHLRQAEENRQLDRLSEKTSKEDATVGSCEETTRGEPEAVFPPSQDGQ